MFSSRSSKRRPLAPQSRRSATYSVSSGGPTNRPPCSDLELDVDPVLRANPRGDRREYGSLPHSGVGQSRLKDPEPLLEEIVGDDKWREKPEEVFLGARGKNSQPPVATQKGH